MSNNWVGDKSLLDALSGRDWNTERLHGTLQLVLGKDWKRVPLKSAMELINHRFGTSNGDYRNVDVILTILRLDELIKNLSREQIDFLKRFDHLPRAEGTQMFWKDGDELLRYEREMGNDALEQLKTEYFVMSHGLIQAVGGAPQEVEKKKMNPLYLVIAVSIIALTVIFILS